MCVYTYIYNIYRYIYNWGAMIASDESHRDLCCERKGPSIVLHTVRAVRHPKVLLHPAVAESNRHVVHFVPVYYDEVAFRF